MTEQILRRGRLHSPMSSTMYYATCPGDLTYSTPCSSDRRFAVVYEKTSVLSFTSLLRRFCSVHFDPLRPGDRVDPLVLEYFYSAESGSVSC